MHNDRYLPKFSIVTPSYNQGGFVEWTIKSVLDQRYPELEYIFMDGGSQDQTLEVIERYRSRFFHCQSAPDGGQSAAIADGLSKANGDILCYLNSDDMLLPGALNYVADFFQKNPEVDVIYGHRCIINQHNQVVGHWILPPHSNYLMKRWDLIPQETTFWRRRIFERAGNVSPTYRFAMDYDLFVRYMTEGKFYRANRFLAAFRVHEDSKTSTLINTVGKQEVELVRAEYKLSAPDVIGSIFSAAVKIRSARFIANKKFISGLPPGRGYNLGEVWNWPTSPARDE